MTFNYFTIVKTCLIFDWFIELQVRKLTKIICVLSVIKERFLSLNSILQKFLDWPLHGFSKTKYLFIKFFTSGPKINYNAREEIFFFLSKAEPLIY